MGISLNLMYLRIEIGFWYQIIFFVTKTDRFYLNTQNLYVVCVDYHKRIRVFGENKY